MRIMRELPISLFAGLAGLALASWWLAELMAPPAETAPTAPAHTIDYYAKRFVRTEMRQDGAPKSRLTAEGMEHFVDDGSTVLDRPLLLSFNLAGPPWEVRAEVGSVLDQGKRLFLSGKAILSREAYGKSQPLLAISKNVTVHMDQKTLDSNEFSEIFNHPNYTSGTGLHADFSDGLKLTLLSRVRGRYEF